MSPSRGMETRSQHAADPSCRPRMVPSQAKTSAEGSWWAQCAKPEDDATFTAHAKERQKAFADIQNYGKPLAGFD